jgi:UDP-N-acetylglucosamine diphosphorylase/glucosamine-1-phosphate N-acetyltransferase
MTRIMIFDDGKGRFGPMTDLRAAFELRTGMLTTAQRIMLQWPKRLAGYWVPASLAQLVSERANAPVNELPNNEETLMCVNGRWAMPSRQIKIDVGHALIEAETGHVIAAHLRHADAVYFLRDGQLHERVIVQEHAERALYLHPWHIHGLIWKTIPQDILATRVLDAMVPDASDIIVGEHPIEIHSRATIMPNVVLDATHGPIIIDECATIRPSAVICGPCAIGPHSTVMDHATIKPNTAIGPHCKVSGEVGSTIFQGYSNKAHDGHLGDSWVGEWVNFGAGTTNSNLLNTYSEVAMRLEPSGPRQRTGLTFLGCIVGDHAKFAINTRIMTGSVIGTGAMIATTAPAPTTTQRFAWITDEGERTYRWEKFIEVAKAMMGRRRLEPSEAYTTRLREVFDSHV